MSVCPQDGLESEAVSSYPATFSRPPDNTGQEREATVEVRERHPCEMGCEQHEEHRADFCPKRGQAGVMTCLAP